MKPVNVPYSSEYILSEQIIWTGTDIACLGICHGQFLNSVVAGIATKVCEALAPYDLSTLTLECVYDILNEDEVGTRTLLSVLQTMADANCTLKELIDALTAKVDGLQDIPLVLDLKCFKSLDPFGNELPYDEQSVLQLIINEACSNKEIVAGLGGKITELDQQVQDIQAEIDALDNAEPIISTCISSNKPVSQSVKDLASNYCDYKDDVGDSFKIQQNISKLSSELNQKYATFDGWTPLPSNMADFVGNLAVIIQDNEANITHILETCCQVSCKDLTLGFEITPASTDTVYIRFTELAGTDIPVSFVDKGSTLQISDTVGNSVSYNIEIVLNKLLGEFSYSGLDVNSPLLFSVTGIMGNDSITCEKCISRNYSVDSTCPVCLVGAVGSEGSVTIVYSVPITGHDGMPSSTSTLSVTLGVGQTFYIPSTATIIALNSTGDVTVQSDCIDTNVESGQCYGFLVVTFYDNQERTYPFETANLNVTGIVYDGVDYDFETEVAFDDITELLIPAIQSITSIAPLLFSLQIGVNDDNNYGSRRLVAFKTPPSVSKKLYLKVKTHLLWAGDGYAINMIPALPYSAFADLTSGVPDCESGVSSGGGQA